MTSFLNLYFDKSIRVSQDGFYFARTENGRRETMSFPGDSGALLSVEAAAFFNESDSIDVVLAEDVPMLIPAEIFDTAKTNDYLRLHTDTSKSARTVQENMGGYVALACISSNRSNSLESLPNKLHIHTEASLFHRHLVEGGAENTILASQNKAFFDMMVVSKGELQLLNRFDTGHPDDTIYYMLNAIKVFGMKAPEITVIDIDGAGRQVHDYFASKKLKTTMFEL